MSSSYYDDDILFRILALDALEQQNSKMQVELSSKKIVASTSSSSFASTTKTTRKASASNEQKASASLVGLGGTNLSDVGGTSFPIRPYQRQPTDVYPRKNLIHTDPETRQTTHEEAMLLPVNVQVQFYMTNPFAQNVNGTRPNPQSLYGYRMNEIKPVDLPDIETGRVRSTLVLEQSFQPYSDENPRAACPWAAGITALPTGYNSYRLHNSRGQLKEYRFYPKSSKSVNDRGYVFHFLPTSLQRSSDTNILDCGCFFLGVEEVRSPSKGLSTEANSSEFAPTFRDLPWFLLPELTIDTASGEPKLLDSEPATEDRVFNEDELYVLTRAYLLEEMCERRKYPFDTIMSAVTTYAGFRRTTNTEGEEPIYRHQHMSCLLYTSPS